MKYDRCWFGLQNQWIHPNLVHRQEKFLQCLWGWPSVRMWDSPNHVQGNDLGAGWIDHHTDLLLLFALLYGMVKSEWLTYSRETTILNLVQTLEWYDNFPLYEAVFANRRSYGEDQPDPFPVGETINCWPPWDIDSCLVLAPDPSAKKTQSRKNHTKIKGYRRIEEKGYAAAGRAREGIILMI